MSENKFHRAAASCLSAAREALLEAQRQSPAALYSDYEQALYHVEGAVEWLNRAEKRKESLQGLLNAP